MSKNILEIKNLSIMFGGIVALDDVNMTTKKGTIHGLIGPNGAGKTTLFNIMTGIYKPTSGNVYLNEKEITGFTPNKIANLGIARTFQNIRLFNSMSVLENVLVAMHNSMNVNIIDIILKTKNFKKEEKSKREKAEKLLEYTGLVKYINNRASSLPYGYQRRLEIARALATNPSLLVIDEPAAGMNHKETSDLKNFLDKINSDGTSILIIEHDVKLIMNLCSFVTVLDFGKIICEGVPEMVKQNKQVIEAYLGA